MQTHQNPSYDTDFYAWIQHNVDLLRQGKFSEIDLNNVVVELDAIGRSKKNELAQKLSLLMLFLLRWYDQDYVDDENFTRYVIAQQRWQLIKLLKESPSLRQTLEKERKKAYEDAVARLVNLKDTEENKFPARCPLTLNQCLDMDFFPQELGQDGDENPSEQDQLSVHNRAVAASMGKGEKGTLVLQLSCVIGLLLGWQYQEYLLQDEHMTQLTIKAQRLELLRLLKAQPIPNHELEHLIEEAYEDALIYSIYKINQKGEKLPARCPFTLAQCLDIEFFPEVLENVPPTC